MSSNIFTFLATPITWVFFLLIISLILLRKLARQRGHRIGWYCLLTGTCILYLSSIPPVSNTLVYSLESQYKSPSEEELADVDIVAILGGGVYLPNEFHNSPEASGATYSRLINGVKTFKQSSAEFLVLSGGGEGQGNESEAEVMKNLAIMLGVPEKKIITEQESQNTMEQAIGLAKLFPPEENKRIGIVTSAIHMPRAVQAFQEKFPEENIVPVPVGYISSQRTYGLGSFIPKENTFMTSSAVMHEEIGLIWYRLRY